MDCEDDYDNKKRILNNNDTTKVNLFSQKNVIVKGDVVSENIYFKLINLELIININQLMEQYFESVYLNICDIFYKTGNKL